MIFEHFGPNLCWLFPRNEVEVYMYIIASSWKDNVQNEFVTLFYVKENLSSTKHILAKLRWHWSFDQLAIYSDKGLFTWEATIGGKRQYTFMFFIEL